MYSVTNITNACFTHYPFSWTLFRILFDESFYLNQGIPFCYNYTFYRNLVRGFFLNSQFVKLSFVKNLLLNCYSILLWCTTSKNAKDPVKRRSLRRYILSTSYWDTFLLMPWHFRRSATLCSAANWNNRNVRRAIFCVKILALQYCFFWFPTTEFIQKTTSEWNTVFKGYSIHFSAFKQKYSYKHHSHMISLKILFTRGSTLHIRKDFYFYRH